MKKNILSILFVLAIGLASLFGQNTFKPKYLPYKYKAPYDNMSLKKVVDKSKISGEIWRVFSVDKTVYSYDKPNGSRFKRTGFLQLYYVVDETDEWIHIVKDNNIDLTKKTFTNRAEDYGWVKKSDFLLSKMSMVQDIISKLPQKAMIINSGDILANKQQQLINNIAKYYADPQCKIPLNDSSGLFKIYYIYKKSEDAYLLGKGIDIYYAKNSKNIIVGWVKKEKVTLWNNRLAIEPNFDIEAASERREKGIKTSVFLTEPQAVYFNENGKYETGKNPIWNSDKYEKRNNGYWIRFPYEEYNSEKEIMKVVTMGELVNNKLIHIMTPEEKAEIDKKITELKQKLKNINIVFVIDATTSMSPYFPPIEKAIEQTISKINTENKKDDVKIKTAALVYRDYPEYKYGKLVKAIELTTDYEEVIKFLKKIKAGDIDDDDAKEALYYGLINAIRGLGMDEGSSNFVVLVGDAGNNDENDKNPEYYDINESINKTELIYAMKDNKCNLLAFQVHNGGRDYEAFNTNVKDIMQKLNQELYDDFPNTFKTNKIEPTPQDDSYNKIFYIKNPIAVCRLLYLDKGDNSLSPHKLQSEVVKSIHQINIITKSTIKLLQRIIDGNGPGKIDKKTDKTYVDSYTNILNLYLSKVKKVDTSILKTALDRNFQFYYEGYTPKTVNGLTHPLYKSVLLMSSSELVELRSSINNIERSLNVDDQREALLKLWQTMLKRVSGTDLNDNILQNKTWGEINAMVYGIPENEYAGILKKYKYSDIPFIPDKILKNYAAIIQENSHNLKRISEGDNYKYMFIVLNTNYYWINIDYLP